MSEIVATVTDPARVPRPRLYASLYQDRSFVWNFGYLSTKEHAVMPTAALVTIPGEIEAARAAKIEAARDAVIQAAKDFCVPDYIEGVYAALKDAVAALAQLEKEQA